MTMADDANQTPGRDYRETVFLPFNRGQPEHLLTLWQRIWDEREPLQLVSWAKALQEKP